MPTASRPARRSCSSRSRAATSTAVSAPFVPGSGAPKSCERSIFRLAPTSGLPAIVGGFVLREDDRVLRADTTACGATLAAVVGLLDEDGFLGVDAVDAEEAEVDALQAIRAAAEVDDRVPPPVGVFVDDGGMWALCFVLWALSLSVAGSIGVPVTVSGTIAIGEPLPAGEITLHLFRFGSALDPTCEFEGGGAEFVGNAADFVEVDGRGIVGTQVEGVDFARRELAPINDAFFVVLERIFEFVVVVFFFVGFALGLEERDAFLAADLVAVEDPARRARKEPTTNHHVTRDARETQHAAAVGLEVVQMRNHRHVDAALAKQAGNDFLFQRPLFRVLATTLRNNNGQTMGHSLIIGGSTWNCNDRKEEYE